MTTTNEQSSAAGQARAAAESLLNQTGSAVKDGLHQMRHSANRLVDQAATDVGVQLKSSTEAVQQSLQPLRQQQPAIASLIDSSVSKLMAAARRVEQQDLDSLVDEVSRFAHRKPLLFSATALAAGLGLGRLALAVIEAEVPEQSGPPSTGQPGRGEPGHG